MTLCGPCLLAQNIFPLVTSPDCVCQRKTPFEGTRIDETGGILIKVQYPGSGPTLHIRLWEIPILLEFFKTCNKLFGAPLILPPTLHLPAKVHKHAA